MRFAVSFAVACLACLPADANAQPKPVPDINESKEFKGVYHSPSADSTPAVFRSVLQMEIVVQEGDGEAEVRYANGVVVSRDGLIVSLFDRPASKLSEKNIQSATALLLGGGAAEVILVKFDASHGLGIFRAEGLGLPALGLSKTPLVQKRRLSWHAVFRDGRKTFLYSRPLQVHHAKMSIEGVDDLCEIIDRASSSLNADRSGSALLSFDGSLVAIMGRQPHWNVSPKNVQPRTKTAWAVPAKVVADLIAEVSRK